jgi:hypothetical protein
VPITVWKTDKAGQANGVTTFTRVYATGAAVSFTAPAVANQKAFDRWEVNGVPYPGPKTISFNVGANTTMKAVYGP